MACFQAFLARLRRRFPYIGGHGTELCLWDAARFKQKCWIIFARVRLVSELIVFNGYLL